MMIGHAANEELISRAYEINLDEIRKLLSENP